MTETFTNRRYEDLVVTKLQHSEDGEVIFVESKGSGFGVPKNEKTEQIEIGDRLTLECYHYSSVAGLTYTQFPNAPLFPRRSDEYFEAERLKFIEDSNRRSEQRLEEKRDEWTQREQALPDWLRERLERFHRNGGHEFDRDAWGYELNICEMAALFVESNLEEDEKLEAYFSEHGASGNQVGCAKQMAAIHMQQPELDEKVPAGLTPLSGNPYYKGEGVTEP